MQKKVRGRLTIKDAKRISRGNVLYRDFLYALDMFFISCGSIAVFVMGWCFLFWVFSGIDESVIFFRAILICALCLLGHALVSSEVSDPKYEF